MTESDLERACREWREAKEIERYAIEDRRRLEDRMLSLIGVPETFEGTENAESPNYRIKITGRMNRKIDADALREAAASNGLEHHLDALFRWRAELNLAAWKNASPEITRPLATAITTKPGRPSFAIEPKEDADGILA